MSENTQKNLTIPTPEGFNFHDLNLVKGEDGKSQWNRWLFGKILQDNGQRADDLTEVDIEMIMGGWYSEHLANGGENEEYADYILCFFTEELLAGDENYGPFEPAYEMSYDIVLATPEGFSFSDLDVKEVGHFTDSKMVFNEDVLKSILESNGLDINNLSEKKKLGFLISLYDNHIENGGEANYQYDRWFDHPGNESAFEAQSHHCAVVYPPRALRIKKMRELAGHSVLQVGTLLELPRSVIKSYESGEKVPDPYLYTLWLILTGQHPTLVAAERPHPINEDAYAFIDEDED